MTVPTRDLLGSRRIKTIVHLDPTQRTRLEELSQRTGAPISELLRRALKMYLDVADKQR